MSQSYWTAASETYQRENNIIIIQLNNRGMRDRSFYGDNTEEDDVRNARVAPLDETFEDLRQMLREG